MLTCLCRGVVHRSRPMVLPPSPAVKRHSASLYFRHLRVFIGWGCLSTTARRRWSPGPTLAASTHACSQPLQWHARVYCGFVCSHRRTSWNVNGLREVSSRLQETVEILWGCMRQLGSSSAAVVCCLALLRRLGTPRGIVFSRETTADCSRLLRVSVLGCLC